MGGMETIINNCCKRPLRAEMTLIDDLEQTYLPLSHLAAGFTFSINTLISDLGPQELRNSGFLVKKAIVICLR